MKSLHQKPRARLVPLPESAGQFIGAVPFGDGSLLEVMLKWVRERTQLPVQRNDFKLETLSPHLLMNFRVVDEHGRQLGMGRNLAALKAELGGQARSAFQALAALKLGTAAPSPQPNPRATGQPWVAAGGRGSEQRVVQRQGEGAASPRYTAWTFGELPELMEVRAMVGFPALIDKGAHVEIEVFDEPDVAAAKHRAGLRRLVALQIREPLKYLEKNIPDLQKMAVAYMPLGTLEELRAQIVDVAMDRAFLGEPLPKDEASFKARLDEGRGRLNLIAQEVARQAGVVLADYAAAVRKLKDARPPKEVADDIAAQLSRLVPKDFIARTPWAQLQHLPRYLKAVQMRLDKLRGDPQRDAQRMAELRPLEQRWVRRVAELKGRADARLDEYRWLLEELRVSLFAQELRTPQPVSAKRLDKAWAQLVS
jgi:ATP-dependent helicase HrpA